MSNPPKFEFDRYINGVLMAEGVTIKREPDFDKACVQAAKIASYGKNGEMPVLVYRGHSFIANDVRAQGAEAIERPERIADAIEAADWSNVSIGNKAILKTAVVSLRADAARAQGAELHPLEKFGSPNVAPLGLYRVHWKSGGNSLAAIGMGSNGDRWIAPTNWIRPADMSSMGGWGDIEWLERIEPARAQGEEVEPGNDIAKQRFELWFFRDILDEHRLKLLTLFGVPTNDQTGQTHGFQKRVLRHIWLSLTTPPAPQPRPLTTVGEEAEKYRVERGEQWCKIFDTLRHYSMSNMIDEYGGGYPLVDLVSRDGEGVSIADGEYELVIMTDEIALAIAPPAPQPTDREKVLDAFEKAYPELFWHVGRGKVSAGEPLYGAIIATASGTEIGHGESDVSLDDAFKIAIRNAGLEWPVIAGGEA
ncbi:hypothetical protein IFT84_17690 [Rhizobium sp. CFBP 8762]|uniref:hypothetical protein n=1 Tax=Rhizobium sp. CFBP 8762 TaxID=2775279 RepID=UPI001785B221|nr:hypothetical protein [Rhizobium sp. CFBP 8762]MBD8556344.1 hypothetical protein [Rhizobium sp. CFBP 8762]